MGRAHLPALAHQKWHVLLSLARSSRRIASLVNEQLVPGKASWADELPSSQQVVVAASPFEGTVNEQPNGSCGVRHGGYFRTKRRFRNLLERQRVRSRMHLLTGMLSRVRI